MSDVAFGVFDHLERLDQSLGQFYADRIDLIKMADTAGFYAYHPAEHHATPLGMAPSPNVFLAAAAQHTQRIRLAPLLYLLPLYNPLRLIEEICMLDHLSNGRLEVGVGRGVSPYELAYFEVPFLESQAMFTEALDVLVAGLRGERLSHSGKYYQCTDMPLELHPQQTPNPPFWHGVTSPRSLEFAATRGMHMVGGGPIAGLKEVTATYRALWAQHRDSPGNLNPHIEQTKIGALRHIFVAETDQEAEAIARPAYRKFYENIMKLWIDFGTTHVFFTPALDIARKGDVAIVGSPSSVQDQIARLLEEGGCNYPVLAFAWGDLSAAQAQKSLDLFASKVMPAFG